MQPAANIKFEGVAPILRVSDLDASIDYYTRILGFRVDWRGDGGVGSVSRGRCSIMLVEGDQGHPGAWLWAGVSDCRALFDEYTASGATIRNPPTNYFWAREMQVEDLDGNVLRFGSEPGENEPFGPWKDMDGVRWIQENGQWKRVD